MNATDLQNATAEDILSWTYRRFGRVALVASFQAESMVLIDIACKLVPHPEVLTLDTGRLHEETHQYIEYVREQFPIRLRILAPDAGELEAMTSEHGDMPFLKSVPLRNQCCAVRKVNPLAGALRDYDAWITGLRRDQTPTRAQTPVVASDVGHDGMIKVVPLASWTREQVWDYLRDSRHPPAPALRSRLHVDRLRALHARHAPRGAGARRPLVVGKRHAQGVPPAPANRRRSGPGCGCRAAGSRVTTSAYYPVVLDLHERRCVVFGDTALADEKAAGLRTAGALVEHLRRAFQSGDLAGAYLAIDASGDPDGQRTARAEADREHVLLNVADVTHQCDWIAPALVKRGPLQVAISTSGESPYLARALRERMEVMLGEEWGPFTEMIGRMRRRLRRAGVSSAAQQRAYQRLLRSEVPALLREGNADGAAALALVIEQSATASEGSAPMGEVVLAGAGPGDPELITVGARAVLADADVVFHDALIDARVLALCGPRTRLVDVGKRAGRPSITQAEINGQMIDAAIAGDLVLRLKGGDPFLFGRGGEEVDALQQAGIPVRVIPGVSAALAAPAAAGIPVTHRDVAASVAFVTGHRAGDHPNELVDIARAVDTLVVLMPAQLDTLCRSLAVALGADRPAAIVSHATRADQRVVRAPIGRIAAVAKTAQIEPPSTLVVGHVVNVLANAESASRVLP